VSADLPAAPAARAIYGPHCSHDECGWSVCGESGLLEHCCRFPGCPECGGLRNEPEDWGSDPARFAAMTPDVQDRVRAYWARYPLVRRGPDDTAERAHRDLAEHNDEDDYDDEWTYDAALDDE
jgi:hypothetical protein